MDGGRDGRRKGWMDGWMAGWMARWMDEWMECKYIIIVCPSQLEQLQSMLTKRRTTVSTLQRKYQWLLYISGARVSLFYDLLRSRPPPWEQIVQEVIVFSPHIIDNKTFKASIAVSTYVCYSHSHFFVSVSQVKQIFRWQR